MEKTLILIKPDAVQRELVGTVISRFERKGFTIAGLKMIHMDGNLAKEHYSHLVEKSFYPGLEEFMTHQPIVAMVIEGKDAVEVVRKMVGKTNAREADPGTIRGDYSLSVSKNTIHASDSKETAEKEVKRFFKPEEIFSYKKSSYYYSEDEL
ncbi:nucleoside-diphosphate kinase [Candidatus Micrarchaeota archaeon]|nr:nucleoside-diphosphate kinase [Candidatus Micrarchaeota archaeon]